MNGRARADSFYDSPEWLAVRYEALKASRGRCACCGAGPTEVNPLRSRGSFGTARITGLPGSTGSNPAPPRAPGAR